jgi:hypothetical protein
VLIGNVFANAILNNQTNFMKRYIVNLLLLLSLFLFTGCFEIIEEISLNDNGSGNISMTANLSRSKTKISSIMLMDSINGYKVPKKETVQKHINKIVSELKQIKGVSNVKYNTDFNDYIFNISCDFTNVEVLNKVILHFTTKNKANTVTKAKQFSYNKKTKTFVRTYKYNIANEMKKINEKDKDVLQNASVTTIYRFQSSIISASNKKAHRSKNQKAIMLNVTVQDIINHQSDIKNTIKLK